MIMANTTPRATIKSAAVTILEIILSLQIINILAVMSKDINKIFPNAYFLNNIKKHLSFLSNA